MRHDTRKTALIYPSNIWKMHRQQKRNVSITNLGYQKNYVTSRGSGWGSATHNSLGWGYDSSVLGSNSSRGGSNHSGWVEKRKFIEKSQNKRTYDDDVTSRASGWESTKQNSSGWGHDPSVSGSNSSGGGSNQSGLGMFQG